MAEENGAIDGLDTITDPNAVAVASVPVIPCDHVAIERAMTAWPLPGPPIGGDSEAHMAWRRDCAERVLRAAGKTP